FLLSQVKTNLSSEALMKSSSLIFGQWRRWRLWGLWRRGKQPGLVRYALSLGYFFDGAQGLILAPDQKSLADLNPVSGCDHFGANAAAGVIYISVELIFIHLQFVALA